MILYTKNNTSKCIIITEEQIKKINKISNSDINKAVKNINTNPSDAQKKAGNYKMGHIKILGFDVTIENPRGSYRTGIDNNGKKWRVKMPNHYGYIKSTEAKDGDAIDVFIGKDLKSEKIFIIDQKNNKGNFDEYKVMMGFTNKKDAKEGYMKSYSNGWNGFMNISEIDIETFREWALSGKKRIKPFGEYVLQK